VWAGNLAGACVLCGGGAAGGWTRPAPGPPLPPARAARRSQSCAIGRPKGSICTCTAGPARTSPPPSPRRHAGRGCEPAGPSRVPQQIGGSPRTPDRGDRRRGLPRVTRGEFRQSAWPVPARALRLLRPVLLPRLVRGRPAARRRLASHHHMARGQIATAAAGPSSATAKMTSTAGPEAASADVGCLPGSLMACPAAGTGRARCP
jgi:hypothetical protein